MGKLAVKRLTASDLTLFEWQFRNRNAGNQKAINLNADVFIDRLYPLLPNTEVGKTGRVPLDLYLFGPGYEPAWNLQRKIIKLGTYKNWRLNGEYISNPHQSPTRFNVLVPDDFAVFDFEGEIVPHSARAVLVSAGCPEDVRLHAALEALGTGRMAAITLPSLTALVQDNSIPTQHPIHELLLDAALEDAAHGGVEGTRKLLSRRSGRALSKIELENARREADAVGRLGEEFVDGHFAQLKAAQAIKDYDWVSSENAVSPFDFWLTPMAAPRGKVEVKATRGDFRRVIHVSMSELSDMRNCVEAYALYRVFSIDNRTAKLRIVDDMKSFATQVLTRLEQLPTGVTADGVSVRPDILPFGEEVVIRLLVDDEVE